MSAPNTSRPTNRILAALPDDDYQRLLPHLEPVSLSARQVLHDVDELIEYVYFPNRAIASLLSVMHDGSTVEVALVGEEGVTGVSVILGSAISFTQAIVQFAGSSVRMRAEQFKTEFAQRGALQTLVLRYVQALLIQVSQSVACNRLHRLEERFARWLLTFQDRVQDNRFSMTQELIAQMLGTRRSSVTEAAVLLQEAGIIRYSRGNVTILDRQELEAVACECYGRIKAEYQRLLDTEEISKGKLPSNRRP